MTYKFISNPSACNEDVIIATSLTGVAYTKNNRLHVRCNDRHFLYKFDGSPALWHAWCCITHW